MKGIVLGDSTTSVVVSVLMLHSKLPVLVYYSTCLSLLQEQEQQQEQLHHAREAGVFGLNVRGSCPAVSMAAVRLCNCFRVFAILGWGTADPVAQC